MKGIWFLLFIAVFVEISAQQIDRELKSKLDSIMYKDQTLRALYDDKISLERKQEICREFGISDEEFEWNIWKIINRQDSINMVEIQKIIADYGYPGKSLVGEPTYQAAWYVIQHSGMIEEYFPLIREAGEKGEIPMKWVAMMEDRKLMQSGQEQIYGTQGYGQLIKDEETGEEHWFHFIWPIKDTARVNELRKSVGIESTVEEYAEKRLGIKYEVYSLEEVQKMLP